MTPTIRPRTNRPKPFPKREAAAWDDPRPVVGTMTPDEYYAFEETATVKHEYLDGKVITMPGGSHQHSFLIFDIGRIFGNALEAAGLPHDMCSSDQRVYVSAQTHLYPDMTIADYPAQFDEKEILRNPLVVAEVISPSSANYDRGKKFDRYRAIESLRHYLLIEQNAVSITHYEKLASGLWAIVGRHTTLDDVLSVSIGDTVIAVPLAKIYARVSFADDAHNDAN